jgi:xanthine dehydrogenase FAD-binding subunit
MEREVNEHLQPAMMQRSPPGATPHPAAEPVEIKTYLAPRSLDEATEALRSGAVTILAGGTDLMPQSKTGRAWFHPTLMNIRRIPELRGISEESGVVRIGALTTVTELMESALIRSRLNALWQACDHFASDQLRNAATIGGNICNASPAGDMLVPLLVFDSQVVLAGKPKGEITTRTMPLRDFFVAPGRTRRAPDELVTTIEVPLPDERFISAFFKFGTRPALDISAISIGLGATSADGMLTHVRVAFGAVAPTPIRAPQTEAALEGRPLTAVIDAALAAADAEISPISDIRASEWYRRELIRNILREMIDHVGHC